MTQLELAKLAASAKQQAYSPYYKFRVGAALQTKSGKIYTGCNIETGAGFSLCAERVAAAKAISAGDMEFERIAVATDAEQFATPCGVCRQFLTEFAPKMDVILFDGTTTQTHALNDLLPHSFHLK